MVDKNPFMLSLSKHVRLFSAVCQAACAESNINQTPSILLLVW
jgi:hypothetical protein